MIDANDVFASDTYNSQENNEFERQVAFFLMRLMQLKVHVYLGKRRLQA
jgi:hypothetical protein